MGLVAIATILAIVFWVTRETDKIASANSVSRVEAALASYTNQVAFFVEDYGHWDDGYRTYMDADADLLYDSFGSGAAESDVFDFLYLIGPDGTVHYAYFSDVYESDVTMADPSVANLGRALTASLPVDPYTSIGGLVQIQDKLAIVSFGRLQPYDLAGMSPDNLPIIMGGLWVDENLMTSLQDQLLISSLQLMTSAKATPVDMVATMLVDIGGQSIGKIVWMPPQPGTQLRLNTLPVIMALMLLILIGSGLVGRAASRQFSAYMQEHSNARTDGLTGLTNRLGLRELVNSKPVTSALAQGRLAVLYIDLNGFKQINDQEGHDAGDVALRATALRLRQAVGPADHIARVGGDEFLCLILDSDPHSAVHAVAARISQSATAPIQCGNADYIVQAAMGITIAKKGAKWDNLLTKADQAMYHAKRINSTAPVLFSERLKYAG